MYEETAPLPEAGRVRVKDGKRKRAGFIHDVRDIIPGLQHVQVMMDDTRKIEEFKGHQCQPLTTVKVAFRIEVAEGEWGTVKDKSDTAMRTAVRRYAEQQMMEAPLFNAKGAVIHLDSNVRPDGKYRRQGRPKVKTRK